MSEPLQAQIQKLAARYVQIQQEKQANPSPIAPVVDGPAASAPAPTPTPPPAKTNPLSFLSGVPQPALYALGGAGVGAGLGALQSLGSGRKRRTRNLLEGALLGAGIGTGVGFGRQWLQGQAPPPAVNPVAGAAATSPAAAKTAPVATSPTGLTPPQQEPASPTGLTPRQQELATQINESLGTLEYLGSPIGKIEQAAQTSGLVGLSAGGGLELARARHFRPQQMDQLVSPSLFQKGLASYLKDPRLAAGNFRNLENIRDKLESPENASATMKNRNYIDLRKQLAAAKANGVLPGTRLTWDQIAEIQRYGAADYFGKSIEEVPQSTLFTRSILPKSFDNPRIRIAEPDSRLFKGRMRHAILPALVGGIDAALFSERRNNAARARVQQHLDQLTDDFRNAGGGK